LVVQRPFYPEGDPCHVYLVHPPGGVVGGDQLHIAATVGEQAHALITTPASGKFYRSHGPCARLEQQLQVDEGGVLEWLPQDTILFAGCEVDMLTRIELAPQATFIGWEILCLGRPSSGEQFEHGRCRQRFELWRGDQPLAIERSQFDGGSPMLTASWGLQGHSVSATLLATPANKTMLTAVRDAIADEYFSATLLDDVLVCRYLGSQGIQARAIFQQAWTVLRPLMLQRPACAPRIWLT
jgi:urease accessory protein